MEHLLIYLIHFVLWLDRRWQKPVQQVIPDFDVLRDQPAAALSQGDIIIGPFRRWASTVALSMAMTGFLGFIWYVVLLGMVGKRFGNGLSPGETILFWTVIVLIGLIAFSLSLRWLSGGVMILRPEGVEMRYRKLSARCPWSLFNAGGNPFQPAEDRLLVPVQAQSVPLVEAYKEETFLGRGKGTKTRMIRFKSANLALLRSLYEAQLPDLGRLLLHIGRQLGEDQSPPGIDLFMMGEPMEVEEAPAATRNSEGWLTVSLTRLELPPYCCDCGAQTSKTQTFQATSFMGELAQLEIPVCEPCQQSQQRVQRRATLRGVIYGIGIALVITVALGMLSNALLPVALALSIPLLMLGLFMGAGIGQAIGKRNAQPVQLKEYSPSEGLVRLKFHNTTYSDAVMEVLQGKEEASETVEEELAPW